MDNQGYLNYQIPASIFQNDPELHHPDREMIWRQLCYALVDGKTVTLKMSDAVVEVRIPTAISSNPIREEMLGEIESLKVGKEAIPPPLPNSWNSTALCMEAEEKVEQRRMAKEKQIIDKLIKEKGE